MRRSGRRFQPTPGLLLIAALFPGVVADAADSMQQQREALNLISDFAEQLCKDVPLRGADTTATLSGEAKAELDGLLKRIANLNVGAAAEYQKQDYEGLLQKDLVKALETSTKCRLQVWNDLKGRLLFDQAPVMAPGTPAEQTGTGAEDHRWELLGAEDFTFTSGDWSVGRWDSSDDANEGNRSQHEGVYRVDATFHKNSMREFDLSYPAAHDFRMGIDMRFAHTANDDDIAGIFFARSDGSELQYLLLADGNYALTRSFDDGPNENVLEWVRSGVDTAKWNRLEVEVVDQMITLRLNGSVSAEYRDPAFRGGTVGYLVGASTSGSVSAEFDNFTLHRRR